MSLTFRRRIQLALVALGTVPTAIAVIGLGYVGLPLAVALAAKHPVVGFDINPARVAALTAIGIGFGGAMTYGQTVGLSHDPQFNGNWEALRWGMREALSHFEVVTSLAMDRH